MMVTTQQKLEVVNRMIAYWEERPDRWITRQLYRRVNGGACLMGNLMLHDPGRSIPIDDVSPRLNLSPVGTHVKRDLGRELYGMPITAYNDNHCVNAGDALRPLYRMRAKYEAELASVAEPVAETPHDYNLA